MLVSLVPEDDLRQVLRPHRVDSRAFEVAVRERLKTLELRRESDPLAGLSSLSRAAATMIPTGIITGERVSDPTVQLAAIGMGYKMLAYLAFPAICMFLLVGATIFSLMKIRWIQSKNAPKVLGEDANLRGIWDWWHHNFIGVILVYAATLFLSRIGATWLLFLLYIVSFGLLLHVLSSLAKRGLGNRWVIGQSCSYGLFTLAQNDLLLSNNDIHLFDQSLLARIFFAGGFSIILFGGGFRFYGEKFDKTPRWLFLVLPVEMLTAFLLWLAFPAKITLLLLVALLGGVPLYLYICERRKRIHAGTIEWARSLTFTGPLVAIVLGIDSFGDGPDFSRVTPGQIKNYVETYEDRSDNTATWAQWEIPARWAVDMKLNPDLSKPQRILNQEIDGKQNPFILGIMFRMGMVREDQLEQLKDYPSRLGYLLDSPEFQVQYPIVSLEQFDWVIRAAVMHKDLTSGQKDYLARRLLLTIEQTFNDEYAKLETVLLATELLDVIDRPNDRERYRMQIHELLRETYSTTGGGFQPAGGFKPFVRVPNISTGTLESTSDALQLMAIYGIPDEIDLDWLRSNLRAKVLRVMNEKWIAPVLLDRLNHLPGIKHPSWFRVLYYERTFLGALVLVAMCIYATLSSPVAVIKRPETNTPVPNG